MAAGPFTTSVVLAGLLAGLSACTLPAAAGFVTATGSGAVASVDDTASSGTPGWFSYAGQWSTSTSAADYGTTDHYTAATGASVTLHFTGAGVQLYGATAPWHGWASASLDGGAAQRVDFYSATRVDQALVYRSGLLSAGAHTLVLTATGGHSPASTGTVITVDRADIYTSTPPAASSVSLDDPAAPVTYQGGWLTSISAADFGGSDHYTAAARATVTLPFTGTAVRLYGSTAPWHGQATVTIDGVPSGSLDAYSALRHDQALLYASAPLTAGPHTLVETVTGTAQPGATGTVIAFDRADIATAPAPVPAPTPVTAPPVTAPPAPTGPPSGFVTRCAGGLCLDGKPYRFAGFNAYSMATQSGANIGCGPQVDDLDGYFSSLRPSSLTRVAAEQQQAIDPTTHQLSFVALDRLVSAAARHGQKLILTLGNEWAGCDDGTQKDQAWFAGGYRQVRNSTGFYPLSYWDYMRAVVARYKDSPAIGMWELVNEPKDGVCSTPFVGDSCNGSYTCPADAAATMRSFFDTVGGELKRIDPNHLLTSGVVGDAWQCGTVGQDYTTAQASPALDVLTYHDYGADNTPLPGDTVNGLATRLSQAATLGKPLFVEEAGIQAASAGSCVSLAQRTAEFQAKMNALFGTGGVGYLIWNWMPTSASGCDHTVGGTDPTLALVHNQPL